MYVQAAGIHSYGIWTDLQVHITYFLCKPFSKHHIVVGLISYRFSKDNLFTTCLLALLKFYLEPSMAVKSAAYVQVRQGYMDRITNTSQLLTGLYS